jgi:hypothetical protein
VNIEGQINNLFKGRIKLQSGKGKFRRLLTALHCDSTSSSKYLTYLSSGLLSLETAPPSGHRLWAVEGVREHLQTYTLLFSLYLFQPTKKFLTWTWRASVILLRSHMWGPWPCSTLTPSIAPILWWSFSEEIGRNQATHSIQLAHEKAIIIHVPEYFYYITRLE